MSPGVFNVESHRLAHGGVQEHGMESIRSRIEACLEKLRSGTLAEDDLRGLLESLDSRRKQSLLYVYAAQNSVTSPVLSMSIIEDGKDHEGLNEKGEFLYESAHHAMQDGWRVVKFPEMTLAMDEQNTYGLGFEFVLERYA